MSKDDAQADNAAQGGDLSGSVVSVAFEDGIAWVTMDRAEKRNAINPTMNREMTQILEDLEIDERCKVLVLTGAGEAFCAGMDLKEYFRETKHLDPIRKRRNHAATQKWTWRKLRFYPKPTIAMINGWAFGGALTPLVACDLAICADEATFGVSEINWGIVPGGNVTKALETTLNERDALWYIMTGDTFDGKTAAAMGLVNRSVPRAQLRSEVVALARKLMTKNPITLWNAKSMYKHSRGMDWDMAEEYSSAKSAQNSMMDPERGSERGLTQFLDEKSFKPGLGAYRRGE